MPRPRRMAPRDLCEDWPVRPCADGGAEAARLLAIRLREVVGAQSLREVGARSGVDFTAIAKILSGASYADSATLARLEDGLSTDLWPRRAERS